MYMCTRLVEVPMLLVVQIFWEQTDTSILGVWVLLGYISVFVLTQA